MDQFFATGPELDYTQRLQILMENHIALWDVIETCERPGSLDSAISEDGMTTNDFSNFFTCHPHINRVYFNGLKAAALFKKKVSPYLTGQYEYHTLPSTSPANAGMNYAAKLKAWSIIKTAARHQDHPP